MKRYSSSDHFQLAQAGGNDTRVHVMPIRKNAMFDWQRFQAPALGVPSLRNPPPPKKKPTMALTFLNKSIPLLEGNFPSGTFEKLKCFQNLFLSRVVASFFCGEKWMAEGRANAPPCPLSESEDTTHRLDTSGWSIKHPMAGMFIKEPSDEAFLVG